MNNKINPFKPNSPVPPGMFSGRYDEIMLIEKGLYQVSKENAINILLTGDRGIGKSSLINLANYISKGEIETTLFGKLNLIPINITISKTTSIESLMKLIENCLSRELNKIEKMKAFLSESWKFIKQLKIMDSGFEEKKGDSDPDILADNFSYSLYETSKKIKELTENSKDGIVFFIDEVDNASESLQLGYFLKYVTEKLQQLGTSNVAFFLAGLPQTVEVLMKSHESSLRIFQHLKIKELKPEDRNEVIQKGLDSAKKINGSETTITKSALSLISTLSEGYPHFIQQFGYSAFSINEDDEISKEDVVKSAFNKGGAIDELGSRYYQNQFNERIKSDEYREVLTIMAESLNDWVKKSDIKVDFSGSDSNLSAALRTLTERNIILKNVSKQGEYRLQQRGFAIWIKLFGRSV